MERLQRMTPEDFLVDFMLKYDIDPDDLKRAYIARLTYDAMVAPDPDETEWLAQNMTKRIQIEVRHDEE